MEKNGYKIIAVVALVIAVVALSIGFASFSATLSIQNAQANIQPGSVTLDVHYKNTNPPSVTCSGTGTASATIGSLSGDPEVTWSGVTASLGIGESVTCTAVIQNESSYKAYLNSITFASGSRLQCSSSNQNIQNMTAACDAIRVSVKPISSWVASGATATVTSSTSNNPTNATALSGIFIPAGEEKSVQLVIEYDDTDSTAIADDIFTVTIPTVQFAFDTAD